MMQNFLYIDPGTGSMLFSLFIGIATTLVFAGRALIVKLRFVFSGGKAEKNSANKIPYVIFSDSKRYWNVFKPVCDEFESRKIPLVYYTQSEDDPVFSANYECVKPEFIGEGNKGISKMNFLNADVCLSTTPGLGVLQWKRSRDVKYYVHIPHLVGDLLTYKMFGLDHFDSILLTGEYQAKDVRDLEKMRDLPEKELLVTGSTYMDAALEHVKTFPKHETNKENPVVLVAPSWGESAILSKFGEKLLDRLVETGWNVIVRPHPQSKTAEKELLERLEKRYCENKNLSWNYDNDNLSVLNKADIMITDFSGVIFDYTLLFDRPVIYADTEFDSSVYDADWVDHELWTFEILREIGIKLEEKQFGNIKSVINNALNSDDLSAGRKKAKETAWQKIGESAKITADYLIELGNRARGVGK